MRLMVFILALLPVLCMGQENLVPHGSFEEYSDCPVSASQGNRAVGWTVPNLGSPEFFHSCSESDYLVPPEVIYGYEYPHTGEGFIGMYFFSFTDPEDREYIQTQLLDPIYPGVRYKVSFYVSLAELSRYAVSSVGAHLSTQPLNQNDYWVIDVEPQIQNQAGNIIADTAGWVLVSDTFVSRTGGGEEWLTIGNFNYAADSDTFAFQPPTPDMGNFFHSYYYIDDVSVIALDSVPSGIAEQEAIGFEVWPNPATDVVRFRVGDPSHSTSSGQAAALRVTVRMLDAVGRVLRYTTLVGGTQDDHTIDISALPTGIYFLELTNTEGKRAVRKFVKE